MGTRDNPLAWRQKMIAVTRIVEDGLAVIGWVAPGWCQHCETALANEFWYCPHCRTRKSLDYRARQALPPECSKLRQGTPALLPGGVVERGPEESGPLFGICSRPGRKPGGLPNRPLPRTGPRPQALAGRARERPFGEGSARAEFRPPARPFSCPFGIL